MLKFIYKLIPNWFKIGYYKFNNRRSWSRSYFTFKFNYIKKAINYKAVMEKFKNSRPLPRDYGYALDEKVIEYP